MFHRYPILILAHTAATWYMVGLIWMVQIVHYPLMAHVGRDQFVEYEKLHTYWMTWIVGPPMILELISAVWLLRVRPHGTSMPYLWSGAALLVVIWGSTQFIQVPCHNALTKSFDANVHHWLVSSNWIRTIAWSTRGILATIILRKWLSLSMSPSTR